MCLRAVRTRKIPDSVGKKWGNVEIFLCSYGIKSALRDDWSETRWPSRDRRRARIPSPCPAACRPSYDYVHVRERGAPGREIIPPTFDGLSWACLSPLHVHLPRRTKWWPPDVPTVWMPYFVENHYGERRDARPASRNRRSPSIRPSAFRAQSKKCAL